MKPPTAVVASSALLVVVSLAILISQSPRPRGVMIVQVSNVMHSADTPTGSSGPQHAPAQDNRQGDQAKGRHTITVIDASSKAPVVKAEVTVELKNLANSAKCQDRYQGRTDARGVFAFLCEMPNGSAKTHISIEAVGYWTLSDESLLTDDRLFQLRKND